MTNQEAIEKYKNENIILSSSYVHDGIILDGVINPLSLDFRQLCSPTDNQLDDPHCAGYAAAQLVESMYWMATGKPIQLDAHQIYAKAKEIDGSPNIDGTTIECTLRAALDLCTFLDGNYFKVKTLFNNKRDDEINIVSDQ